MTHRAPHPDQRGFTLLELVVAIAVFAVIAAMAYAGLRSILDSRQQVDAALDRLAELQRAVELLSDDLRQIVPRTVRDNQGADEAALRVLHGRASRLLFTRAGHANPLGLPRSSLQRIAYDLEGQTLVRRAYRPWIAHRASSRSPPRCSRPSPASRSSCWTATTSGATTGRRQTRRRRKCCHARSGSA